MSLATTLHVVRDIRVDVRNACLAIQAAGKVATDVRVKGLCPAAPRQVIRDVRAKLDGRNPQSGRKKHELANLSDAEWAARLPIRGMVRLDKGALPALQIVGQTDRAGRLVRQGPFFGLSDLGPRAALKILEITQKEFTNPARGFGLHVAGAARRAWA